MVSLTSPLLMMALLVVAGGSQVDQRPVTKVINLLKDMVTQLAKEGKGDEQVKEEMDCWCETGRRDKTMAIDDANKKIGQLNAEIPALAAASSKLNNEITTLNQEIAHNAEALDESHDMRSKEMAEFNEDEKNMIGSIASMKGAITTIGGNHEGSFERASQHARTGVAGLFLQQTQSSEDENDMLAAVAAVHTQMHQHAKLVSPQQREVVSAFLKSPDEYMAKTALLQQGTGYNPEQTSSSGPIFGVLKGMKESFEKDLDKTQKDEGRNQASFESLKGAKNTEIKAAQDLVDTKSATLGATDQRRAEARQDLKDTSKTMGADTDYLKNLKAQCANVDEEYAERVKTRQEESGAVSKALAYLSSDDAMDMMTRTFNSASASSFFQKAMHSQKRFAGAKLLSAAAARSHDARLSTLAASMLAAAPAANQAESTSKSKGNSFNKITSEVQAMIDKLVQEKADADKHKDWCIEEIQSNTRMTDIGNRHRMNFEAKIQELAAYIEGLAKEMAALTAETHELQVMLKRSGEDRNKANAVYQQTVADQRGTRALLEGARGMLQSFYNKASLAQVATRQPAGKWLDDSTARQLGLMASYAVQSEVAPAGAPPPGGFKKMEKNAQSGGVMGMIQMIIDDAKAMEAEAIQGEEAEQVAYEALVAETNESLLSNEKQQSHKAADKAAAEADRAQQKIEHENTVDAIGQLQRANVDLHKSCDYELATFDDKTSARNDEIMALKESIPIFSGIR